MKPIKDKHATRDAIVDGISLLVIALVLIFYVLGVVP